MAQTSDPSSTSPVAGSYSGEANTPFGLLQGTINYQVDGDVLTGTVEGIGRSFTVEEGTVNGNSFHHIVYVKGVLPIGKLKVTVDGTVDGDAISGSIKSKFANTEFTGTRI